MSYQLKEVIVDFLKEERITRLSIKQIKTLPKIMVDTYFSNQEIFERIEDISSNSLILYTVKGSQSKSVSHTYCQFFLQLLNERKFEKFKAYSHYRKSMKWCEIQVQNKKIFRSKPQFKIVILGSSFGTSKTSINYKMHLISKKETNAFFRSYSLQKLVTRNNLCNSGTNDEIIFSTHEPEFCRFNCLISKDSTILLI